MELAWVPSLSSAFSTEAQGLARKRVQFYPLLVLAIPNVPSFREKKLLIRNGLTFPLCLPAFVFLFTVYSQSSSPITVKSGQRCSFSGLSLSALGEEGIQKILKIQTPYSTVLCQNLYLPELELSMTDFNARYPHLYLTIIINYRHVLISKSSPWALMKGWTSKIPSLLKRKLCFWVNWGLQCSIAYDFHSPAALWSELAKFRTLHLKMNLLISVLPLLVHHVLPVSLQCLNHKPRLQKWAFAAVQKRSLPKIHKPSKTKGVKMGSLWCRMKNHRTCNYFWTCNFLLAQLRCSFRKAWINSSQRDV